MARSLKSATARSSRRLPSSLSSLDLLLLCRSPPSSPLHGGGGGGHPARSMGTLAFEEIVAPCEGRPPTATALVLHGLLGSGRNWRTFARNLASELAESSSGWRMILVDLRNHGRSAGIEGLDPPHNMVTAARDLANLVKSQKWMWPDVVIGHSMGGKVALEFADSCAQGDYGESAILPKKLWVLDSIPGKVNTNNGDGEVEKVLKTLDSLPSSLPSRKWVVDHMLELGFSKSLSEWIGSNLKKEGKHVRWAFDLRAAIDMFNSYRSENFFSDRVNTLFALIEHIKNKFPSSNLCREKCYWPLLEHPPDGLKIELVRAENSDRWSPEVVQRLDSLTHKQREAGEGKTSVHVLPRSGHWVHVDNPRGLLEIMVPNFLSDDASHVL